MYRPKERIEKRCPGCHHWGKGHVLDIVTAQPMCTVRLVKEAKINEYIDENINSESGRVCSWKDCAENYAEIKKTGLIGRFLKRSIEKSAHRKRRCPICGKKVKPDSFGPFCSTKCAMKYLDEEEVKRKEDEQRDDTLQGR